MTLDGQQTNGWGGGALSGGGDPDAPPGNCGALVGRARALARGADAAGVRQPLHLKVDTGLNRYGLPPAEIFPLAEALRQIPALEVEGKLTHSGSATEGHR